MRPNNPMDPAFNPPPAYAGLDAPTDIQFRVTYNDGTSYLFDADDEADAIAQANNCYAGPAFVVSATPTGRK